jgi:type III secretion protein N (ATPase)
MAKYADVELLVKIGEYQRGGDKSTDEAIDKIESIRAFLRQRTDERADFNETIEKLCSIVGLPAPAASPSR